MRVSIYLLHLIEYFMNIYLFISYVYQISHDTVMALRVGVVSIHVIVVHIKGENNA